jgi:antitoxin CptB
MSESLDVRRRRAAYRAAHRGTKELDILVGRYADAHLAALDGDALTRFERLLAVSDPLLQGWIFGQESVAGSEFESLIRDIRAFHGLEGANGPTR